MNFTLPSNTLVDRDKSALTKSSSHILIFLNLTLADVLNGKRICWDDDKRAVILKKLSQIQRDNYVRPNATQLIAIGEAIYVPTQYGGDVYYRLMNSVISWIFQNAITEKMGCLIQTTRVTNELTGKDFTVSQWSVATKNWDDTFPNPNVLTAVNMAKNPLQHLHEKMKNKSEMQRAELRAAHDNTWLPRRPLPKCDDRTDTRGIGQIRLMQQVMSIQYSNNAFAAAEVDATEVSKKTVQIRKLPTNEATADLTGDNRLAELEKENEGLKRAIEELREMMKSVMVTQGTGGGEAKSE